MHEVARRQRRVGTRGRRRPVPAWSAAVVHVAPAGSVSLFRSASGRPSPARGPRSPDRLLRARSRRSRPCPVSVARRRRESGRWPPLPGGQMAARAGRHRRIPQSADFAHGTCGTAGLSTRGSTGGRRFAGGASRLAICRTIDEYDGPCSQECVTRRLQAHHGVSGKASRTTRPTHAEPVMCRRRSDSRRSCWSTRAPSGSPRHRRLRCGRSGARSGVGLAPAR